MWSGRSLDDLTKTQDLGSVLLARDRHVVNLSS